MTVTERLAAEQNESDACNGNMSFTWRAGVETAMNRMQSTVWTRGIPDDKMTYQVLLQLFVVGDDAVVDDDKL